ncbi:unnamed protein product [Prorocentrum cordatum]|uniref:Uncharacterized protein n=1 Tax=Prorocentrum cordatum TaxID=2364126 RepID=A0ABN9VRT1_9DINO|nr:unnamed protein product [Polarella glacialis]
MVRARLRARSCRPRFCCGGSSRGRASRRQRAGRASRCWTRASQGRSWPGTRRATCNIRTRPPRPGPARARGGCAARAARAGEQLKREIAGLRAATVSEGPRGGPREAQKGRLLEQELLEQARLRRQISAASLGAVSSVAGARPHDDRRLLLREAQQSFASAADADTFRLSKEAAPFIHDASRDDSRELSFRREELEQRRLRTEIAARIGSGAQRQPGGSAAAGTLRAGAFLAGPAAGEIRTGTPAEPVAQRR